MVTQVSLELLYLQMQLLRALYTQPARLNSLSGHAGAQHWHALHVEALDHLSHHGRPAGRTQGIYIADVAGIFDVC